MRDGRLSVARIPGDGIGPEVMRAACRVLDAATVGGINWIDVEAGMDCYKRTGVPLPEETVQTIEQVGLAFKSPLTTPGVAASAVSTSLFVNGWVSTQAFDVLVPFP